MSEFPLFFAIFISTMLGLVFGSFASMASHRLPLGKSLVKGRSHCPTCNHALGVKDLFPVFSWLFARGKCRYCHTKISWTYLLHELSLGCLFTLVFLIYGYSLLTPILWGVATCIVILIAVDLKHYYIPDPIQVTLCILGIGYGVIAYDTFLEPLYGAIIFAAMGFALRLLGYALKKTESLGWGDVKFFGVAGLFLGLDMTKTTLFFLLSGIMGIITALLWKRLGKGDLFPFGPALASALFIILLIPDIHSIVPLISNYLLLHFYAN